MKIQDIILVVLVVFIWGINFVVIKIGLNSFPPLLFTSLRFLFAAFPIIFFVRRNKISWKWIISIGIFLGIITFGLLFIAMYQGVSAGLSSILLQIQVPFTIILSIFILKNKPTVIQTIGIILAFCGIGLLVTAKYESSTVIGLVLIVIAGFSWAIANLLMKLAGKIDMFRLIVWISIIPPIPLFLLSLLSEKGQMEAITHISILGIGSLLFVSWISTIFAFSIWGKLLHKYQAQQITPFALLVPVFGIISGNILLQEKLDLAEIIACGLVFFGLLIITLNSLLINIFKKIDIAIGFKFVQ